VRHPIQGYRQRVGLADTMMHDPPVLILDEPTDGLDPVQKRETLATLKELGRTHTIMLSSHLLSEVESISDRVIILSAAMSASPANRPRWRRTRSSSSKCVGRWTGDQPAAVRRGGRARLDTQSSRRADGLRGAGQGRTRPARELAQRSPRTVGPPPPRHAAAASTSRYLEILSEEDPLKIRFPTASSESITAASGARTN
jgi:energy-coupling factor transporter ATP-binding protein EcfA2